MVIDNNSRWLAFEDLRIPVEVRSVITERKFNASPQNSQGQSWNKAYEESASLSISRQGSRLSNDGLPPSSHFSATADRSTKRSSGRERDQMILSRQESNMSRRSIMSNERERARPDAVQYRTVIYPTANMDGASSQTSAFSSVRGRKHDQSPKNRQQVPTRGRSRGRSEELRPTDPSLHHRQRSLSRARSTASGRASTAIHTKQSQGRSSSRSQLPPTSASARQRALSRSQSLTRVTSPSSFASRNDSMSVIGRSSSRPPFSTSYRPDNSPITIADLNIGGDSSSDRPESATESSKLSQRTRSLGKFFGVQGRKSSITDLDCRIRPRTLLAASVYHNTATNLWITTINTNQRGVAKDPNLANKYLKAFSFHTEHEARESAIANAPPKMVPLSESPSCFMCAGKFNLFHRPCHCRNCGVCVCKDCSTTWSAKQIPDTYNLKNKTSVKICKGCDILSSKFKEALLAGNLDDAIDIYVSGNVNLRTPFPERNKKGELIHPVMCAVQGGNLDVVRWLVEDHFCPIKQVQQTGLGRTSKRGDDALITTSKGRTVLSIALEALKIDILRYFIVDCRMSLHGVADLKTVLTALEATLHSLPSPEDQSRALADNGFQFVKWDKASFDALSEPSSLGSEDYAENDSIAMKSYRARGKRSDSVRISNKAFPTFIDVLRQQN